MSRASRGSTNRYVERYDRELKVLQDEYDKKVDEMKTEVARSGNRASGWRCSGFRAR